MEIAPQGRAATRISMFADIDRKDVHAWAAYVAPDAVMRFGNAAPVYGRDGCRTDAQDLISDNRVYIDVAPVFAPA